MSPVQVWAFIFLGALALWGACEAVAGVVRERNRLRTDLARSRRRVAELERRVVLRAEPLDVSALDLGERRVPGT